MYSLFSYFKLLWTVTPGIPHVSHLNHNPSISINNHYPDIYFIFIGFITNVFILNL